jgi:hypothetical protein
MAKRIQKLAINAMFYIFSFRTSPSRNIENNPRNILIIAIIKGSIISACEADGCGISVRHKVNAIVDIIANNNPLVKRLNLLILYL